ncbi:MAG: 6,7-dimethyl-8-ribityllumazine synthase [Pirellulaceae bacterium]
MPREFRADPLGEGLRFAIVVARYNESITRKLCQGAVQTLLVHGVGEADIDIAWVPGAWEIPVVAQRLLRTRRYAGVICLGAVIRGETSHDQHINRQLSISLGQLALETRLPVAFGILTCHSVEQAIHRSGGTHGNKGEECALAVLEMAQLLAQLPPEA